MPINASAIAGDSASGLTNTEMAMATPLVQTKGFKPVFARLLASLFGSAALTASETSLPLSQSPLKPAVKQQTAASANSTSTDHGAATVEPNPLAQVVLPFQTYEFPANSLTVSLLGEDTAASGSGTVQNEPFTGSMLSVPESDFSRIQRTFTATGTALESAYTTTTALPEGALPGLSTDAKSGDFAAAPSVISALQLESYSNAVAPVSPNVQDTPTNSALAGPQVSEGDRKAPSTTSIQASSVPSNLVVQSIATPASAALGALEPRAIPFGQPGPTSADSSLAANPLSVGAAKQVPVIQGETPSNALSQNIGLGNRPHESPLDTSDNSVSTAANRDSGSLPLYSQSSTGVPPSPASEDVSTNAAEFSQLLSTLANQVSAAIISYTVPDAISEPTEGIGAGASQPATPEPVLASSAGTVPVRTAMATGTQDASASQQVRIGATAAGFTLQGNDGPIVDMQDPSSPPVTGTLRSTAASNQPHTGVLGSNRLTTKAMTAEIVAALSDTLTARTSSPTKTGARLAGPDASVSAPWEQVAQPESNPPASTAPAVFVSDHAPANDLSALASIRTSAAQQSSNQANASAPADNSRALDTAKDSSAASGDSLNAPTSDLAAIAQATSMGAFAPKLEPATAISLPANTTSGGSNGGPALASIVAQRAAEPPELSPAMQAWNGGENLPSRLIQAARLGGNLREAEMNVTMQSESLGAVDMHAHVSGDVVGATIGVERHDAHAAISNDLYALHQALEERQLRVGNVTVVQHGSVTSDSTANDGEKPRQQRSANSHLAFENAPNAEQSEAPSAAVETVESLAMRMIFDSQGRLSVRA